MTPIPKRLVGAEQGTRRGRAGDLGTRCPPRARAAPRAAEHVERRAGSRPPLPQGSPGRRGTQWAREPRARPRPAAEREREAGRGRRGRGPGDPAAGRAGGEARDRGTRLPHRRTNKDARGPPAEPCRARWVRGEEKVAGSLLAAAAIMEGGPRSAPRGEEPPARRSPCPRARARPSGGGGAGQPRAPGEGGDAAERKLVSGLFRFTGLAARPSARAHEWRGERGPAAPVWPAGRCAALRSQGPSPRSARAEPLGLSFLRPPAPGAWIDLVALASGSRSRPASTPRLPIPGALARPLARSLAHTRTRAPPPPRDQGSSPNSRPSRRERDAAGLEDGAGERPVPPPPARPPAPRPIYSKEKKNNAARSDFPPPASFSPGGADLVHYLRGKFCGQCLFSEMFINAAAAPTEPCCKRRAHF